MAVPRIELCDPGTEGQRVAEVLRERGFYVVERSVESLREGTEAALLVLAGDAEGAREALGAIRAVAATATTPVILLGVPADEPEGSDPASLADAFYPRPVAIERLVRKVETFLAPPETRLPSQSSERSLDGEPESVSPGPREPTMQLGGDEGSASGRPEPTMQLGERSIAEWKPPERTLQLDDAPSPDADSAAGADRTPPPEPSARPSRPPTSPPSSGDLAHAADLSPRLRRLILDADRRVFPSSPPLDLRFPAGDEPAAELVPDELLETVSLPAEPVEDDPLDAFTYLGPVPEHAGTPLPSGSPDPNRQWLGSSSDPGRPRSDPPMQSAPRTAATFAPPRAPRRLLSPRKTEPSIPPVSVVASSPRPSSRPGSRPGSRPSTETQDEIGFGERTGGGRGRAGDLGEADALRLLWRVMEAGDDVWLTLETDDAPPLRLRVRGEELLSLEGPVALRVLERLCREGRMDERASDEPAAVALLERRVNAGLLGRFELDRMLRRAREQLLYDAIASSGGRFEMRFAGTDAAVGSRLLGSPLGAVLVEGARRRLSVARVRRLLGSGALAIRLTPIAADRFARAQLEPELVALLERSDGALLDQVVEAAPAEEGVAGALFALVAASAVRLVVSEQDQDSPRDPATAVRDAVEAAAERGEDATYFDVIGVAADAPARELRKAYEERRRELAGHRLALYGLEDLEPRRRLALEVLDEAWEVLRDAGLREAYRHALGA